MCRAVGYQPDLPPPSKQQLFNIIKSPEPQTVIQDDHMMEAACIKQAKTICKCKLLFIEKLLDVKKLERKEMLRIVMRL